MDGPGNDGYQGVKGGVQGWGNARRGFFSGGFLLDLAGEDRYSEGFENGEFWVRSTFGAGWDKSE
ncbi:hypothetical protein H8D30_07040 [bacterium]|nr:hypothetical protein [bacterium]